MHGQHHVSRPGGLSPIKLTTPTGLAIATAVIATLGTARDAHADADETRVSIVGVGSLDDVRAFEGSGSTQSYGGGLAVAQGIRNGLDLGVAATYRRRPDTVVDGAALQGMGGAEPYQLYTNLQVVETALTARGYLEVGDIVRTRPLLGVRTGLQVARYADPELFFGQNSVATGTNEWNLSWLVGAEAGVAHRVSDALELALVLSATTSQVSDNLLLFFELSWQRG